MTKGRGTEFGDLVRIRTTLVTQTAGLAERIGTVHGSTAPSLGYVSDVIGDPIDDVAIAVHFGDAGPALWFTPDLVEFVDHQAGQTMRIGGHELVRRADGSWEESPSTPGSGKGSP
jgi:hypothetical protein